MKDADEEESDFEDKKEKEEKKKKTPKKETPKKEKKETPKKETKKEEKPKKEKKEPKEEKEEKKGKKGSKKGEGEDGTAKSEEDTTYKWWEAEEDWKVGEKKNWKWRTLRHNGVYFMPDYVPHGVKMLYDGKPVDLTPAQEEVATFFARSLSRLSSNESTLRAQFILGILILITWRSRSSPRISSRNFVRCWARTTSSRTSASATSSPFTITSR